MLAHVVIAAARRRRRRRRCSGQGTRWDTDVDNKRNNDTDEMVDSVSTSAEHTGSVMTSSGPAPYTGDILANPELVWMDDEWTAEEVIPPAGTEQVLGNTLSTSQCTRKRS